MKTCFYVQSAMSVKGCRGGYNRAVTKSWEGKPYDKLTIGLYEAGARTDVVSSILHNPLLDEYII